MPSLFAFIRCNGDSSSHQQLYYYYYYYYIQLSVTIRNHMVIEDNVTRATFILLVSPFISVYTKHIVLTLS